MSKLRRSKLSRALGLAGFLVAACGGRVEPARFETAGAFDDDAPRRAPGVSSDHAPALPSSQPSTDPGSGVVVLRAPIDPAGARAVVRSFFRVVLAEEPEELSRYILSRAQVQTGSMGRRQLALGFWTQRLARLDYSALGGQRVYRESEIETYRGQDLQALDPPRRFPIAVPTDAVLVRVPISTQRVGRTRLFGDQILFLLSLRDGEYKIAEMVEDFQLP